MEAQKQIAEASRKRIDALYMAPPPKSQRSNLVKIPRKESLCAACDGYAWRKAQPPRAPFTTCAARRGTPVVPIPPGGEELYSEHVSSCQVKSGADPGL